MTKLEELKAAYYAAYADAAYAAYADAAYADAAYADAEAAYEAELEKQGEKEND